MTPVLILIKVYRGTSLIIIPLGPYSRTMPRALWGSYGVGRFLMSEVSPYMTPVLVLIKVYLD